MSSEADVRIVDDGVVEVQTANTEIPTHAILRGIAALKGVPETELGVLYDQIEPDALNDLLRHARRFDRDVSVTFRLKGTLSSSAVEGRFAFTVRVYPDEATAGTA